MNRAAAQQSLGQMQLVIENPRDRLQHSHRLARHFFADAVSRQRQYM